MRRIVLILIILLTSTITWAQDDSSTPWPVIENCVGDLRYPVVAPQNWNFNGIIFTYQANDGYQGLRGDRGISYTIALRSDDTYPELGAVSPDGQYFAYPVGTTSNAGRDVGIDYVRVVRLDGLTDETYRFDTTAYALGAMGRFFVFPPVIWLGIDRLHFGDFSETIAFPSGEVGDWDLTLSPQEITHISPDLTRAFFRPIFSEGETALYDLETARPLLDGLPRQAIWLADSSAFVEVSDAYLRLISRDGEVLETFWYGTVEHAAVAPNQQAIAFRDDVNNLYLVDLNARVVYDLCFTNLEPDTYLDASFYHPNLAWSPESDAIAFTYDGYVIIFNTQTFTNQVLQFQTYRVVGWYPLSGSTVRPATESIRPPVATLTPLPATTTPVPQITVVPTVRSMNTSAATPLPPTESCSLEVLTGANLRAGAGVDTERVGSAAVGFILTAVAQQYNETEYFRWWQLDTGEWIREDFVREGEGCDTLPEAVSGP
ncbi:MAG: hypothetical protein OHK0046_35750 [Anaerolineae bacterium]